MDAGVTQSQEFSFRPLDGESFSKLVRVLVKLTGSISFRPLDGESFSKHWIFSMQLRLLA